jgi:hypothetical protein
VCLVLYLAVENQRFRSVYFQYNISSKLQLILRLIHIEQLKKLFMNIHHCLVSTGLQWTDSVAQISYESSHEKLQSYEN